MDLPSAGPMIYVYWRDASNADVWEDAHDERPRTIEVSCGMLLGYTTDKKIRLAPTLAVQVGSEKLALKLSELEIPLGCILHVERLPDADIKRALKAEAGRSRSSR